MARSPKADWIQPVVAPVVVRQEEAMADDRDEVHPGDAVLLVIEDDPHYGRILVNLARDRGFKVIFARTGADGLAMVRKHRPTAVSLDVFLPDMPGWTVLNQLKRNPETRHIPVQILTIEIDRQYEL